ncbi:Fc.00g054500.m01.CDS01 [Cosmosporella sp. VM-42]
MKLSITFTGLIDSQAACILATTIYVHPDAAAECGALGVMEWNLGTLPEGTATANLRKCKENPHSLNAVPRNEGNDVLEKR